MTTHPLALRGSRLLPAAVAAALLLLPTRAATQPAAPPTPLRSSIALVTLDALVTGVDGRPVTDLHTGEVTLRVDGRPKPIESLLMVLVGDASAGSEPLPPPFGTNLPGGGGRSIVLVVDDDSFGPGKERPLREAVDAFLATLGPRDRVALVTMPYGGTKANLTTQHDNVRAALAQVVGQAPQAESGSELACRTRRTLEALTSLVKGVGGGDGPTSVLFFSSALSAPRRDAPVTLAPGMCELTAANFQSVASAAAAARAQIYVIQPDDSVVRVARAQVENIAGAGFTGSDNPLEGLEHLAGVTGGRRLNLFGAENTLTRIERETSAYYVIAFEPEPSQRNGQPHRIEVRVARPEISVRVAPQVTIERPAGRKAMTPRDMLRQAAMVRDLPLRTAGFVSREVGDSRLKVIVAAELAQPGATFSAASVGLFDQAGRLVAQWTAEPAQLGTATLMGAVLAPPGAYRLRLAATDADGRSGTADHDVANELTKAGPLELSGLVLGTSRPTGFRPSLLFGAQPVATAYLEIFGGAPGLPVSVKVEIARTLNGPALLTMPAAMSAGADRHIASAAVPIGGLPPGDYIVRAIVGAEGQPAGRVMRTLRKAGL